AAAAQGAGRRRRPSEMVDDNGLRAVTPAQLLQWKDTRWRPREGSSGAGLRALRALDPGSLGGAPVGDPPCGAASGETGRSGGVAPPETGEVMRPGWQPRDPWSERRQPDAGSGRFRPKLRRAVTVRRAMAVSE
ncbi:MAG: DUF1175 family protein, partial [Verrucomicrobia bacterium]|nr:DUF1175 family protein [Verrucomicrobiota bacterium]